MTPCIRLLLTENNVIYRQFDLHIVQAAQENIPLRWVDSVNVDRASAANERLDLLLERVQRGAIIGDITHLAFRDPASFHAGKLYNHLPHWEKIAETNGSATKTDVLGWIKNKVSVFEYFRHFNGSFKGHNYDSDRPPQKTVTVKTLQHLVGKCISFALAVPAAKLFTRKINTMIAMGQCTLRLISVRGELKEEIMHWLFLETWDAPLPWRDDQHYHVSVATDASALGWGGFILSPVTQEVADYWLGEEVTP